MAACGAADRDVVWGLARKAAGLLDEGGPVLEGLRLLGEAAQQRLCRELRQRVLAGAAAECHREEAAAGLEYLCRSLLDHAHEKLYEGYWRDVPIVWRQVYAVTSLLCAVAVMSTATATATGTAPGRRPPLAQGAGGAGVSGRAQAALRMCDLGLMMGAPLPGALLETLADHLHRLAVAPPPPDTTDLSETLTGEPQRQSKRARTMAEDTETTGAWAAQEEGEGCPSMRGNSKPVPCERDLPLLRFQADYMDPGRPVVVQGAMDHWPALTKWQDLGYLKARAGARTVPVELGAHYVADGWSQTMVTLGYFVETHVGDPAKRGYLAQHPLFDQIPELRQDIAVPDFCCLGDSPDVDINAWFGPAGTRSPLHHDPKHNFLCQVVGSKYIRLYAPACTPRLYPHGDGQLLSNTSQVDVENPDLDRFPLFPEAPFTECLLRAGDMLYIPPGHWHFVRSLSVSFSVSFWWH